MIIEPETGVWIHHEEHEGYEVNRDVFMSMEALSFMIFMFFMA